MPTYGTQVTTSPVGSGGTPTVAANARNRVIYQSEALGVRGGSDSPVALRRVQSINYSFSVGRTDVNQFGELAAIDRIILEQPTVTMDFSYILHGLTNESSLGFDVVGSNSCITNILDNTQDKKDYFVALAAEGEDAATAGADTVTSQIEVPEAFITSYSAAGSVGEFPTATVNVEALDMKIGQSSSTDFGMKHASTEDGGMTNSKVLRPGEILLDINAFGGTVHLQSFTLTVDLTREPINRLGTNFPFARVISFPVNATLSAEGILVGDDGSDSASLGELVDNDDAIASMIVDCRSQTGTGHAPGCKFEVKEAKLDSYGYTSSVGANKSVSMDWSVPIGSKSQTGKGVFMSPGGVYAA